MRKRDNYKEYDSVFVGQEIYEFKEVSSTMNVIKQVSSNSGTVVVSETQTQGKGRCEREWYSQEKNDLLFSYILNIPKEDFSVKLYVFDNFKFIKNCFRVS